MRVVAFEVRRTASGPKPTSIQVGSTWLCEGKADDAFLVRALTQRHPAYPNGRRRGSTMDAGTAA